MTPDHCNAQVAYHHAKGKVHKDSNEGDEQLNNGRAALHEGPWLGLKGGKCMVCVCMVWQRVSIRRQQACHITGSWVSLQGESGVVSTEHNPSQSQTKKKNK